MDCPSCGAPNPADKKFCGDCGVPLAVRCPACGGENPPDKTFCGDCGARLEEEMPPLGRAAEAPAGELRQVTILFCDLAGYTALSEALDAEAMHGLLNRYFETVDGLVTSFGGTIDKHIGDAVMALFGAPVAHDNDPERAVRAAVAIHDAIAELGSDLSQPIGVHIGIASGQVVASGTGSDAHREYTVTGDSVNLASRLDDLASPGETFISEAVHRAVSHVADCAAVGEVAVKGIAEPVRVWRILGIGSGRAPGTGHPFVGREAELGQFAGVLEACRRTGAGLSIHVRGEPGIGKTRLVDEFEATARGAGFDCHTGLVLDFGVGKGQDAIRAAVRSLLGIAPGADKAHRATAADAAVAGGLLDGDRRVFLNDLLDLPQPTALEAMFDAMDNETRGRGRRETVAQLVRRSSAGRPVMIRIEDIHWARPLELAYLSTLASTVIECPALLIMTSRREGDPIDQAWRSAAGECPLMTIDLAPLRRAEALALATEFVDARLAEACVERAEGNPLFLEQLLRSAEESLEGVPGSIRSIVLARMDRLGEQDKRALQAASVLGQRFSLPALRYLIEDPDYGCGDLVEHFLVRPDGEDFLFSHALIREGVYGSLLKATRRELHRKAAERFADRDPVLRAEHLDRAEDPAAPRAYLEAAHAQTAVHRYERARQLVSRGLELAREKTDVYELTCFLGDVLRELGAIDGSIEAFQRALDNARDDVERCQAWIGQAAGMRVVDRYDAA
ncbi:MAG: adenylate/guanylate cyclase domain-containing protein, partial [Alphaproteobacteria bacterium]